MVYTYKKDRKMRNLQQLYEGDFDKETEFC